MTITNHLVEGWKEFSVLLLPERYFHQKTESYYNSAPIATRGVALCLGVVDGFIKPFLFPLISLVGIVVFPILAVMRARRGEKNVGATLIAWAFSLISTLGSFTLLAVIGYFLPLIGTLVLVVGVLSFSMICHIHLFVNPPPHPVMDLEEST